jgi:glycine/D-amino acid oxidase-like deaminating enzyme
MRVAVIGSGVVGASVAWHLARRGVEVVTLDAGPPGAGVTNWSFSWVNASTKTQTRPYFDLSVAGLAAYCELATTIGAGDWWHPTGHLRWSDDPAAGAALRAGVEHLRSWGYDVACWDAERVRRLLEPDVHFPADDTEVAVYRDEGWIDGRSLVARLLDDALRNGAAAHVGGAVTDIVVRDGQVAEVVVSGDQRHPVDALVNAAGPAADDVAKLVGRTLPMREDPGFVARVRCEPVPIRRAMHAPHVELRPDGRGQVVLHSREVDALISRLADTTELSARLHRLAVDIAPALSSAELVGARVAWRPIPLDGFPSVGGVDELTGYYEAVTHSGITLGAIVGRVLSQEIVDGTVDELVEPYRPGRFAGVERPAIHTH